MYTDDWIKVLADNLKLHNKGSTVKFNNMATLTQPSLWASHIDLLVVTLTC